jgi:NADPH:quinone reductase-like Zn-dependent oxidoreductase
MPLAGHVVIEIKAFGINHAEMHMRRGEWAEAAKVIGIECVGLVKSCPGGEFPVGAKVAALMGGLGRTINGSYAEYTRVRASNVAPIESDLSWAELAAIPETYATAWTCLFRNLEIAREQTMVIRGAASSFGQAALNMATDAGVRVIATTRGRERIALLEQLGAERVETEGPELSNRIAEARSSMRSSTLSVTAPFSIPWPCCAGVVAPAWQAGWAAWRQSPISTRSCRWPAAST